ncbi:uncharacterized protein LOC142345524 [Convolutriloba macropyga]|uniref:uncharacterized protein LOC142345524 n=1 Tax=Convolutriloba macropyga TaxID=536237 RepID=UPI003F521D55
MSTIMDVSTDIVGTTGTVENDQHLVSENSRDDGFSELPAHDSAEVQQPFVRLGSNLIPPSTSSALLVRNPPPEVSTSHPQTQLRSSSLLLHSTHEAQLSNTTEVQHPSVSLSQTRTESHQPSPSVTASRPGSGSMNPPIGQQMKFKILPTVVHSGATSNGSGDKQVAVTASSSVPNKSHLSSLSSVGSVTSGDGVRHTTQYRVLNSGVASARNQLQNNLSHFIKDSGLQAFAQEGGIYEKCGTLADPKVGYLVYKTNKTNETLTTQQTLTSSGSTESSGSSNNVGVSGGQVVGSVGGDKRLKRFSNELLEEDPRHLKQMRFSGAWSPLPEYKLSSSSNVSTSNTTSSSSSSVGAVMSPSEAAFAKNKGLRHFAMKVCQKVQLKGVTSYNEVADELVCEMFGTATTTLHKHNSTTPQSLSNEQIYDQKNVRRRIYDALNVLMALNIISKDKKEIKWIGLPTNSAQELKNLEMEREKRVERIKEKKAQLQELIMQHVAYKTLVQQNKETEAANGGEAPEPSSVIRLPFVVINASGDTDVDCSIASDRREYLFNLDKPFQVHDDVFILKKMGLCSGGGGGGGTNHPVSSNPLSSHFPLSTPTSLSPSPVNSSSSTFNNNNSNPHVNTIMAMLPSSLHEYVQDVFKPEMTRSASIS